MTAPTSNAALADEIECMLATADDDDYQPFIVDKAQGAAIVAALRATRPGVEEIARALKKHFLQNIAGLTGLDPDTVGDEEDDEIFLGYARAVLALLSQDRTPPAQRVAPVATGWLAEDIQRAVTSVASRDATAVIDPALPAASVSGSGMADLSFQAIARGQYEEGLKDGRAEAADALEAAHRTIAELEDETRRLNTVATDRAYMMAAYRDMLGPTGLALAQTWEAKGLRRFHALWGPEAAKMTGEERAQFLLDVEGRLKEATPVSFDDIDRSRALIKDHLHD